MKMKMKMKMNITYDKNGNEIKKGATVTGYQYQGGIRSGKVNSLKRDGRIDVGKDHIWVDPKTVSVTE